MEAEYFPLLPILARRQGPPSGLLLSAPRAPPKDSPLTCRAPGSPERGEFTLQKMENQKMKNDYSNNNLKVLASGDPKTSFHRATPTHILDRFGPPKRLLSSSAKVDKCQKLGILTRILYLTPGIFCPAATKGCRNACLGHTSGRMQFLTHAQARDTRAALYLTNPVIFLKRLRAEMTLLEADALQHGFQPAVRLNGSSDLAWERLHPELFADFPNIQFYDYTKLYSRMLGFLDATFPHNYHLTFSVDAHNTRHAVDILRRGGTAAAVFALGLPHIWWDFPVIDGDAHDARFLDPTGSVVGLLAKGLARVDTTGFTIRHCRVCGPNAPQLSLASLVENTHRHTLHECTTCGFQLAAKYKLPVTQNSLSSAA